MRERDKIIQIRVSEKEKNHILRNAKRCKMSVSSYVRELANGHKPRGIPTEIYSLCFDIELLMDEYTDRKSAEFKKYLQNFLDEIRTLMIENGGENYGDDENLGD